MVSSTGEFIIPRRHFAYSVVGKDIIVHGGIDSRGKFLNDLWHLDIGNKSYYIFILKKLNELHNCVDYIKMTL